MNNEELIKRRSELVNNINYLSGAKVDAQKELDDIEVRIKTPSTEEVAKINKMISTISKLYNDTEVSDPAVDGSWQLQQIGYALGNWVDIES